MDGIDCILAESDQGHSQANAPLNNHTARVRIGDLILYTVHYALKLQKLAS